MGAKRLLATGIDASVTTRCVIGFVEDNCFALLGFAEAPSEGWAKGRISDQRAVAAGIARAVREAERMAGLSVESAVVGIGGSTVRGANCRSVIELGRPREIEQRDVNRAVDKAARVQLGDDRMVLQLCMQDFVVDDHPGHRDPRKMLATRLEANVHLITTSLQEHSRLVAAVNQANLAVEETIFEPFAACYAAVLPEDRREGLALIDIGAQSSDMIAYYDDALVLSASLPVCGDHFTRDAARGLCTTFEDAAMVKEEYGCALLEMTAQNSVIELPSPNGREPREAPRRTLNRILEARAIELFELAREELARVGMQRALSSGLVLTGGGARLNGLCDLGERILNCQARKGLPVGIQNWPDELQDPAWTVAAGLAMYSARLKLQVELERRSASLWARVLR